MRGRAHLADVFRWSTDIEAGWAAVLGAAIGMAGPILVGALAGDLRSGFAAALGGLLVGGAGAGANWRVQAGALMGAFWPTVLAAAIAAGIAERGWIGDAVTVALAIVAGAAGGFSRPMALATTRFIAFLVISVPAALLVPDKAWFALMVLAGAASTVALGLAFGAVVRTMRAPAAAPPAATAPPPTLAQQFRRWGRTLRGLEGWQYAIRISFCLAVASVLRWIWPDHHLQWIAITLTLVAERPIDIVPIKVTQRAIGTAIGVLATGLLFADKPPVWGLVLGAGIVAGARPWLRARNYLAYSVVMSPLIIVVMDHGPSIGPQILADRLVATMIGLGLIIIANTSVGWLLKKTA